MRRHRRLTATLAGGFLAVGFLHFPVNAQRSRVPDREAGEAARPAVERRAPERPAPERASVSRDVVVPAAPKPVGPVANRPEAPARPSERPRDSGRDDATRYDGGGAGNNQNDDRRNGHHDDRQTDARRGNDYSGTTGVVINPVVVQAVTVGSVRLSPATTIGQRVVIGGSGAAPVTSGGFARLDGAYAAHPVAWSEETIYLDDLRHEQRVEVSDEPVMIRDGDVGEPREPDQPRRMTGSLAALGAQYTFRPWYAVSEFVMAGYPTPYPDALAAAYDRLALAKNADLPAAALEALQAGLPLVPFAPGTFGGVTFQIGPAEASVYVDGVFAGLAEDFTPVTAPLPLMVGPHRIELRARGFRLEAFDVIVILGQVTPLSGLLAPQ